MYRTKENPLPKVQQRGGWTDPASIGLLGQAIISTELLAASAFNIQCSSFVGLL